MDLSTIPYEKVIELYGNILSPHHLQRLRCLRAIPKEPRTPKRDSTGSQRYLFSFQEVYTAVLALCPDRTKIRFPFGQEKLFPYDARIFYTWGPRLGAAREVTTSFPYLTAWSTSTGEIHRQLEYARCCLACSILPKRVNRAVGFTNQKVPADALVRFEEEFSEQELLEHLAGCELARRMWADRNMGLAKTVYVGSLSLGPLA
ncbi:hypothetical protein CVT26_005323 [Gymnopilus dilepis]|uniref:Uncharacterized protein n=1 Tax=Gymnopilus dilepis TaxID=231916 RepID=A0A409X4P5_9AGAR|nr:hypothetical protein CVT26_005323 [Gymnopilus dilepis]